MRRFYIILSLLLFSFAGLATTNNINIKKPNKSEHVVLLLSQPIAKQKICAKKGYIGYQNSLSANYVSGIQGNKVNLVKGYAWALIALHQIQKTGNKKLIAGQKKTVKFVAKKMEFSQKKAGKKLASQIIKKYENSWLKPADVLKMKNFPAPCAINLK